MRIMRPHTKNANVCDLCYKDKDIDKDKDNDIIIYNSIFVFFLSFFLFLKNN